jgi:hypothetical protein
VRGITLNYKNSLTINFDTIKDMVINNRDDVKTVRDDYKITRDHKRLLTVHQDKDYMRLKAEKGRSHGMVTQALVSFKKYMPPPLPYFKVNPCVTMPHDHLLSNVK